MTPSPALVLLTQALLNAIDLASQPGSKAPEYRPATRDAVKFARALVAHMGEVTTAELLEVRNAGYSDAQIVEIITHVGLNLLTNILGKASRVEIDFPVVPKSLAA